MIILCTDNDQIETRWQEILSDVSETSITRGLSAAYNLLSQNSSVILFLHLDIKDLHGIAGVLDIRNRFPDVKIIACSNVPNDEEGLAILKAGCVGYCNAYMSQQILQRVIDTVSAGEAWVGQRLMQHLVQQFSPPPPADTQRLEEILTEREREVAQLVASGMSNKQIAAKIGVTERTVKAHMSSLFQKTHTRDRLQLALFIKEHVQNTSSHLDTASTK